MSREPVVISFVVPFHEVDESFDWWMRQYERDSDGQFFDAAQQLKPFVTTETYERWHHQFEHPKGQSTVVVSYGMLHRSDEVVCLQHNRPPAPGYCDEFVRADGRASS